MSTTDDTTDAELDLTLAEIADELNETVEVSATITKFGFSAFLAALEQAAILNPPMAEDVIPVLEAFEEANPELKERIPALSRAASEHDGSFPVTLHSVPDAE